ncbi:MAG: hypothetical protein U0169_10305 [Polyangiaceae bacterium]
MAPRIRFLAVALVVPLAFAHVAHAEGETSATREAEARFEEGKRLYRDKKDFEGARLKFAQAFALNPSAAILWNLAVSELDANRPLEALQHFRDYARHPDAKTSNTELLPELTKRARKGLGRIAIEAPEGTEIVVDGRPFPDRAPLSEPVDVVPGPHVVVLRGGGREKRFDVDAAADRSPAVVRLDARTEGPATKPVTKVDPALGSPSATTSPATSVAPEAASNGTARTVTSVVLESVTLAALGTGIAFAVVARNEGNDAAKIRDAFVASPVAADEAKTRAAFQSAKDAEASHATVANVLFVTSGVAALGAVATWVFWPRTKSTNARLVPWTSPRDVGGSFAMEF